MNQNTFKKYPNYENTSKKSETIPGLNRVKTSNVSVVINNPRVQTTREYNEDFMDNIESKYKRSNINDKMLTSSLPKIQNQLVSMQSPLETRTNSISYTKPFRTLKKKDSLNSEKINSEFETNNIKQNILFSESIVSPRNVTLVNNQRDVFRSKKVKDFIDLNLNKIENKILCSSHIQIKLPKTKRPNNLKNNSTGVTLDGISKARKLVEKFDSNRYPVTNSFMNILKTSLSIEDKSKLQMYNKNLAKNSQEVDWIKNSLKNDSIFKDPFESLKVTNPSQQDNI